MVKKKRPTDVIEGIDNPHLESAYIKFPRELPKDVSREREIHQVKRDYRKANNLLRAKEKRTNTGYLIPTKYTQIHTHPGQVALPSSKDLYQFFQTSHEKTMIIGQQNPKTGEVLGYTILRKTKKAPIFYEQLEKLTEDLEYYDKNSFHLTLKKMVKDIACLFNSSKPSRSSEPLNQFCNKYGLQYKFVPAHGYRFNEAGGNFVKDKDANLESKVAASIAIGGLILGLFLLYPNMTGNVVGNNGSSNLAGVILLIVGLIGAFIAFRKH